MKVKTLTICALLIALSAVGAYIRIPGTTVAFDSFPGYTAAGLLGATFGGIIGPIGHLLTAYLGGFPLGLPVHIIIAIVMGITCFIYGYLYRKNMKELATIIATLLNGPVALFLVCPIIGWAMFPTLVPILSLISFLNISVANLVIESLQKAGIKN